MDDVAVNQLFTSYLASVRAHVLPSDVVPDEALMRSVELEMEIPDTRKDQFRRELVNFIGALALDGKTFEARTNPRLFAALQKVVDPDGSSEPLAERGLRLLRARGDDDSKLTEARRCFEQALAEGDIRASLPLASMLREGMGGAPDPERARQLYTQVYERSEDPRAGLALALMIAHGEGGPADPVRGYQLLRPIAATGDLRAVAALLDLASNPDEIAEAEQFAEAAKQALIRSMT